MTEREQNVLTVLKELRRTRKLGLKELSGVLGYNTHKGYFDVENGNVKLTVAHLFKLADFYNVPMSIFFASESSKTESSS